MIKKILLVGFFVLSGLRAENASVSYLSFMHLDGKSENPISEQIKEHSVLLGDYYDGLGIERIMNSGSKLSKVYNPCDLGVCGLNILKGKYYKKQESLGFAGKEYSVFYGLENGELRELFLIRKIKRKEYSLQKNQKDTVFEYFAKRTNLLKEKENTQFFLDYCYNGRSYLGSDGYKNILEMDSACNRKFRDNLKETSFTMEKRFREIFYIQEKEGLTLEKLNGLVQKRKVDFPFKRDFKVSIVCSAFNYCIELLHVENLYSGFMKNNFMIYDNNLLIKDLEMLENLEKERSKIHCNANHKEKGLPREEFEKRLLCDARFDIFNQNILYVLKVNKYNQEHMDFSGVLKYKNIYNLIEERRKMLVDKTIAYTPYQKMELEMEIKEYEYLLSLIKVYPPKVQPDVFPYLSNEEVFYGEYDYVMLKQQIEFSKTELERYKREKVQYLIDREYTRLEELKRIMRIKF